MYINKFIDTDGETPFFFVALLIGRGFVAYDAYPKLTLMGRKNRTYGLKRCFKWLSVSIVEGRVYTLAAVCLINIRTYAQWEMFLFNHIYVVLGTPILCEHR